MRAADISWKALKATYLNDPSLIERAILDGKDESGKDLNTAMPRWRGKLSEAEVNSIINYLQTLH